MHILIVHGAKHIGKLLRCIFNGRFCIDVFIPDLAFNGFNIIIVFKHHLMDFKNGSLFFADLFDGFIIQDLKLFHRRIPGIVEAFYFSVNITDFMSHRRNGIAVEKGQRPDGNTWENTFPFESNHRVVLLESSSI